MEICVSESAKSVLPFFLGIVLAKIESLFDDALGVRWREGVRDGVEIYQNDRER